MELFHGLYNYEIVLMVAGILFFIFLVLLLAYLVVKGKEYKQMLAFFVFPVIMIGFPGVKKISYDNGKI